MQNPDARKNLLWKSKFTRPWPTPGAVSKVWQNFTMQTGMSEWHEWRQMGFSKWQWGRWDIQISVIYLCIVCMFIVCTYIVIYTRLYPFLQWGKNPCPSPCTRKSGQEWRDLLRNRDGSDGRLTSKCFHNGLFTINRRVQETDGFVQESGEIYWKVCETVRVSEDIYVVVKRKDVWKPKFMHIFYKRYWETNSENVKRSWWGNDFFFCFSSYQMPL